MRQAPDTVALYLERAVNMIDGVFGKGYAKEHPELVAAFLQACQGDYMTSVFGKVFGNALDGIATELGGIAKALRSE
jgi:hypothetical protein